MKETPPHRCKYFRKCDDCLKEIGYFSRAKPPSRCVECRKAHFKRIATMQFASSRHKNQERNFLYEKTRKDYGQK